MTVISNQISWLLNNELNIINEEKDEFSKIAHRIIEKKNIQIINYKNEIKNLKIKYKNQINDLFTIIKLLYKKILLYEKKILKIRIKNLDYLYRV